MNISMTKSKKTPLPTFDYQSYFKSLNKMQYINDLLLLTLVHRKQESAILCLNELNDLLITVKIPLKVRQLHELYIFSTLRKSEHKQSSKQQIAALMNNQKKKVDVQAAVKWIHDNINKGNIKFGRVMNHLEGRMSIDVSRKVEAKRKLPPIRGTSNEKLSEELKTMIDIFEEMEGERKDSGLIPINMEDDEEQDQLDLSPLNIPYDPELYALNNNLAKLRFRAEDRFARILELAQTDPKIRVKLEDAIQKFQRVRMQANEKVGRIGSMKAQKRVLEAKKKTIDRYQTLKLGEEEDLLRAARLHSLLSIQERKQTKFIL